MRARWYMGWIKGSHKREIFKSTETPTTTSHGHRYSGVMGPFRTKRGATFSRDHGQGNPHTQTVADAERIAKKLEKERSCR